MTALAAGAAFALACSLLLNSGVAARQAAPAGNLYQDVISHQASINWQPSPADNYPDDACNQMDACSADGSKPKVFVLPFATIDGHRTARGVYLVKIKDPKQPTAVVFEHQTASETYFFRLASDGSLMKTAYLARGGSWLLIANSKGQPVLNKDAPDWHAALSKAGAK
jgi:hypothetical protein